MIRAIPLRNILFLDIETVSTTSDYYDLSDRIQYLWLKKMKRYVELLLPEEQKLRAAELFTEKAAIYAEFGKIVCVSCGVIKNENDTYSFHTKSFYGHDEKEFLDELSKTLNTFFKKGTKYICGHNIKEFDVPYMCRRYLVHGSPLPNPLNLYGKKPWETTHLLDTMAYWKFGDYKSYTSLDLLSECLGVESPKDELDGSQVSRVYWKEDGLEDIVKYCEKDIFAVAKVFLKLALHHHINLMPENATK